jgi:hypothetical protein
MFAYLFSHAWEYSSNGVILKNEFPSSLIDLIFYSEAGQAPTTALEEDNKGDWSRKG